MVDHDRCYECTGYGDDWVWSEDEQKYVRACDDCVLNENGDEDE